MATPYVSNELAGKSYIGRFLSTGPYVEKFTVPTSGAVTTGDTYALHVVPAGATLLDVVISATSLLGTAGTWSLGDTGFTGSSTNRFVNAEAIVLVSNSGPKGASVYDVIGYTGGLPFKYNSNGIILMTVTSPSGGAASPTISGYLLYSMDA